MLGTHLPTARFLFIHVHVVGIRYKSNLTWESSSEVMPRIINLVASRSKLSVWNNSGQIMIYLSKFTCRS
jgi:hypothetical protein